MPKAQYRSQIVSTYFSSSGNDLFDAMTKLYYRLRQEGQDVGELYESIDHMLCLPMNMIPFRRFRPDPGWKLSAAKKAHSSGRKRHRAMETTPLRIS